MIEGPARPTLLNVKRVMDFSAFSISRCLWSIVLLVLFMPTFGHADQVDSVADTAFFEKHIRPVLVAKCLKCHGEKKQAGELRLDSIESVMKGGDSGPAITRGRPEESLLMEGLNYESFEMPPSGQLDNETISHFRTWISRGAVWPATEAIREESGTISDEDRNWWAFRRLDKPAIPEVDDSWAINSIDHFVLERLHSNNMQPAPQASRQTLIRRLYFDLLGVPPTVAEIDQFLADDSQQAWEKLVDRLLDDKRYGEHWARYWLDLVRYSESDGWNQDAYRPNIYRYRDYVVQAFNKDLPYPDFVRQQLAGDEIEADDPELLEAAGFLRLGIFEYNQRDARGHWNDIVNEMTDVAGDVFFGLSMSCARCHDHKFDPIPQRDYFKLRAFFEPIQWRDDLVSATKSEQQTHAEQLAKWEAATKEIRDQIDSLIEPYHAKKWESTVDKFPLDIQACFHMPVEDRTSWQDQMAYLVSRQFIEEGGGPLKNMKKEDKERHEALKKELAKFDNLKPKALPKLMTATDFPGVLSPTFIPDAADREPVQPGFLAVMPSDDRGATANEKIRKGTSGRRTALASWIGDPTNPLTNRVIVNRIWQQHFGDGICSTPSDFGFNGSRPSHPKLLDHLTGQFIQDGWSMKKLHKRILLSATWQQSASHPQANAYQQLDPGEKLLWRSRVRRLQAEQIRDAMLVASGELDKRVGGPSVDEKSPRRGLYVKSFRNKNDSFMHGFDLANGLKSVPARDNTTTPTQALLMINGSYALDRARKMASRLAALEPHHPVDIVRNAFRAAWGIEPTDDQMSDALRFVDAQVGEDEQKIDVQKLSDLCHVLFNSNQFLYVK